MPTTLKGDGNGPRPARDARAADVLRASGVAAGAPPARDGMALAVERARVRLLHDPARDEGSTFWTWHLESQRVEVQRALGGTSLAVVEVRDPAQLVLDVHEDDRARVVEALHAVVDGRLAQVEVEHRLACAEPCDATATTRTTGVRDARGAVVTVVGLTRLLDARAAGETRRRAHLRQLEAIAGVSRAMLQAGLSLPEILEELARTVAALAGGSCAVRLLDGERRVLEAPAVLSHDDARRRSDLLELLGRPQPVASSIFEQVIEAGVSVQLDGAAIPARLGSDPLLEPPSRLALVPLRTAGDVIGVLMVARDSGPPLHDDDLRVIQELANLAGRAIGNAHLLAHAERLVRVTETFVGVLGHDLRNPLGAIATCAHVIKQSEDLAHSHRAAARIERSAGRMTRMIEQLLDFTRMRVGRLALERAPADAGEVCLDVVEELRQVHGARPICVEVLGEPRGAWDRDRLGQLISNLVGNAVDHGDPDVPVTVLVDGVPGDVVRIDVHSGGAIPPARIPTIFEPMGARAAVGHRRPARRSGLGLGLFIVRHIARAHGGDVLVSSSAQAGTTFSVTLPRS